MPQHRHSALNNGFGIHPKLAAQSRPRVIAAKAIGAQGEVAVVLWKKGAHAFRHSANIVGGSDDGAAAGLQLLRDKWHRRGCVTGQLALMAGASTMTAACSVTIILLLIE